MQGFRETGCEALPPAPTQVQLQAPASTEAGAAPVCAVARMTGCEDVRTGHPGESLTPSKARPC